MELHYKVLLEAKSPPICVIVIRYASSHLVRRKGIYFINWCCFVDEESESFCSFQKDVFARYIGCDGDPISESD